MIEGRRGRETEREREDDRECKRERETERERSRERGMDERELKANIRYLFSSDVLAFIIWLIL